MTHCQQATDPITTTTPKNPILDKAIIYDPTNIDLWQVVGKLWIKSELQNHALGDSNLYMKRTKRP